MSGHSDSVPAPSTVDDASVTSLDLSAQDEAKEASSEHQGGEPLHDPYILLELAMEGELEALTAALDDNPTAINIHDSDGLTLLHWACLCGHADVALALIHRSADVKAKTLAGSTPLHDACRGGLLNVVELLLKYGADVDARSANLDTPLHEACRGNHVDLVKYLLDHRADIEAQSSSGNTALHWASMWGAAPVVSLLLQRGADREVTNRVYKTPLEVVISANDAAREAVIKAFNEKKRR
jgi:ankyrin repeat protein